MLKIWWRNSEYIYVAENNGSYFMNNEDLFKSAFTEARSEVVQEFREELSSMETALEAFFNNVLECCNFNSEEILKE